MAPNQTSQHETVQRFFDRLPDFRALREKLAAQRETLVEQMTRQEQEMRRVCENADRLLADMRKFTRELDTRIDRSRRLLERSRHVAAESRARLALSEDPPVEIPAPLAFTFTDAANIISTTGVMLTPGPGGRPRFPLYHLMDENSPGLRPQV